MTTVTRLAHSVGYRIPSNRVGRCTNCGTRERPKVVVLLNVRAWPGEGFDHGECTHCGSTLAALEPPPDAA